MIESFQKQADELNFIIKVTRGIFWLLQNCTKLEEK